MKKIKKLLSLFLVFAIVLTVIPAISVEAKSGVIKKTVKKKFIIEKFDDQDDINSLDEMYGFPVSEYVALVNECGGWNGVAKDFKWEYNDQNNKWEQVGKGTYLNLMYGDPIASDGSGYMTVSQAARSLKNMYGKKYSCVKKADLKNTGAVSYQWLAGMAVKIAKKRHVPDCVEDFAPELEEAHEEEPSNMVEYSYWAYYIITTYPGMDPRVDYKYSE